MFGTALANGLNRGAAIASTVLVRVFSDGGDSANASDKDKDDDVVCLETPLLNRNGGGWLSIACR